MSLSKVLRGLSENEFRVLEISNFDDLGGKPASKEKAVSKEAVFAAESSGKQNTHATAADPLAQPLVQKKIEEAQAAGRKAGLEEGERRFAQAIEALGKVMEDISRLRQTIMHNSSHDMLQLVLTIVRQVLQVEISVRPEVILATIERALQASISADYFHVKVNPGDLDLVQEKKPFFLTRITGLKNITFEGDESIAGGGCRVESEFGDVDAAIETQLEEIKQFL
ncbi:MAG: flagellar assembly protein FliH, partial [Deltaproteobacteria bacterium]|nr:flagellar assembly protein FliH [Deltaproteobacteria bacterium]